jgi:3-deoxy-D-manno-octulosonate 8-phosphate phosphatase (KDO 8-P phosphatase)
MSSILIDKPIKPPVNWQDIKLVVFDCDGVLTDGRIIFTDTTTQVKNFNAHDGLGFGLLHRAGLLSAVITGNISEALKIRCSVLQVKHLYQGVENKLEILGKLLIDLEIGYHQVVYMGDDWNDVPCMLKAAFSVSPVSAVPEVKELADFVTKRKAGKGAVRECIEHILLKKGIHQKTIMAYLQEIS